MSEKNKKNRLALMAAMKEEIDPIRDRTTLRETIKKGAAIIERRDYGDTELILVQTGIGKVNAAMATTMLIEHFSPDLIINIGSAGALHKDLKIGDIVIGDRFAYGDADATAFGYRMGQIPQMPHEYILEIETRKMLEDFLRDNRDRFDFDIRFGQVITSDSFIADSEQSSRLCSHFPDVLVAEMESAAIAQVAHASSTPLIVIRSVSDTADRQASEHFKTNLSVAAKNTALLTEKLIDSLISL